ncbi:MAG TPA: EAL domain-containing protein [Luteibacter sp.]|nr:EAL domain-containing protein [Luteibacter sp.]
MTDATGVLIVAAQRERRRRLFDALDGHGGFAILSARDTAQADALLSEEPSITLAVVLFEGDTGDARACCELLRSISSYARVPILAVLGDDEILGQAGLPDFVADWMHVANVPRELVPRALKVIGAPVTASAAGVGRDYRFAFDRASGDWCLARADNMRIVDAGASFLDRWGGSETDLVGRPLQEIFRLRDVPSGTLPTSEWQATACTWRHADGSLEAGELDVRRIVHGGERMLAIAFRGDRRYACASRALSMLAAIQACPSDDEGIAQTAAMVADALELDFVEVWAALPEEDTSPQLLTRVWHGDTVVAWPDAAAQPLLLLALGGEAAVDLSDAARLAPADPLIGLLGLHAFAGLPLIDERQVVLGAFLAGKRGLPTESRVLEPALRAAASRFAAALELRRAREQGRAKGLLDALTGLPNRLLFNDRLDTTIREAQRTGECFAVLFVDLDRFKSINDSLGHSIGDQVLTAVARRLRASVRASDTVARYAGDEFTLILRHIIKRDDVLRIAEKIVQVMEGPLSLDDGSELQITISIGVSFFPDDATDGEHLLRHADEAMYGAKSLGRNNFQIYAQNSDLSQQQHVALKAKLRHAERNNELRVFYQPQVDAVTEDIVGMEALVRWEHPELGTISPAFFIPLAEASGLIVSIGEWVLRTACAQAHVWERMFGLKLRLGVNLSAVQLMQQNLVSMVANALNDTGLDPSCLELEVTESISVKTVPNLVENLDALHALGCRIAIDDFGTGAASLDYLRRLPADRIKIDQSFVRNIGVDPDDEAIVRATIEMAHRLKRGVVAEGVEIEQHLEFLRANGCDELQGYLFCRPLPQATFEKLLAERERVLLSGLSPVGSA